MVEYKRDFFINDPEVIGKLHQILVKNHKVANHTKKVLFENRHTKDFCEEARHFTILQGNNPIYLHYDVSSWYKSPAGVRVVVESIGVYDDFMDFEKARMLQLHKAQNKDIPNIN